MKIPLDPQLPAAFDCTDNYKRSTAELDAWWDKPYGVTRADGKIDVHCLNGGTWNRSMQLGTADSYEAACTLAAEKQSAWVAKRSKPIGGLCKDGISLVIPEQRPDQEEKTIGGPFRSREEMMAWVRANHPELEVSLGMG